MTSWTSARRRSCARSSSTTSTARSRSARRPSPTAPGSACRPRPCATRCRCSSATASSPSPTPRPAGYPPTRGYRYYVDHLAGAGALPAERRRIADFFTTATMAMDDLLHETSQLLARVTAHAAVVVGPQPRRSSCAARTRRCSSRGSLLAVVVMSNGAVEKETVVLDADVAPAEVDAASALFAHAARRSAPRRACVLADDGGASRPIPPRRSRALVATRVRTHRRAAPRRAALRRRRQPARGRAGSVRDHEHRGLLELLEQHVVLGALLRELLGPGLTVRIGSENELGRPARVLARARAVSRRGRADRDRRRARPDAHGLSQGAGRGRHGVAAARPAALSMMRRPLMATRLLRTARRVDAARPTTRSRRRTASGARVPPRREPRRSAGGRALQGDQRGVRDGARPRAAPPVRHVRSRRRERGAVPAARAASMPAASASTTSSTRSSAATRSADVGRPARRGPDAETVMELTLDEVVTGVRRTVDMRMPVECETCGGSGGSARHPSDALHDLRRRGRGAPGPPVAARPDRDRRSVPDVRADSATIIDHPVRDVPAATAGSNGDRSIEVEVPAGIDDGQRLRLAGRGPAAPRGGVAGDLFVGVRVSRPLGPRTPRRRPLAPAPGLDRAGRARREDRASRRSTASGARGAVGHAARRALRLQGLGVPSLRSGRRGDLVVEVDVQVPTNLTAEEAELLAELAELRGER